MLVLLPRPHSLHGRWVGLLRYALSLGDPHLYLTKCLRQLMERQEDMDESDEDEEQEHTRSSKSKKAREPV